MVGNDSNTVSRQCIDLSTAVSISASDIKGSSLWCFIKILQANVKEFENVTIELPVEEMENGRERAINDDVMQSVSV